MDNAWLNDYRKVPDEVMSYIRKIAVRAIEEGGMSVELIAQVFGVASSAVYVWVQRYRKDGYAGLDTRLAPGADRVITKEIEDWLRVVVLNTTPLDHGFETSLWTCEIMRQLLYKQFYVDVQPSTISIHLKAMGLTYQKPDYVPLEQDPKEVEQFLSDKFPRIQRLAKKLDAEIAFEDEAGIAISDHGGKTWGNQGETPKVIASQKRGRVNVLSMVAPAGWLRYSLEDETIDSNRFIAFLEQRLRERTKPLILLLDRARFHTSKQVRQFVRAHRAQIRIYFLPKYSPQMNPAEHVWNTIKSRGLRKMLIVTKDELKKKARSQLKKLQLSKDKIKAFFKFPETRYVLDLN
jgi:transposase